MVFGTIYGTFEIRRGRVEEEKPEIEPRSSTMSIIGLNYTVKEWIGPWWKGACLRKQRKKKVLTDITMQLKSGQITAILGNSGKLTIMSQSSGFLTF